MEGGPDRVGHNLLDLHDYVPLQVNLLLGVRQGEVPLQLAIAELVARLILAVVLAILLHRVVDQVDVLVVQVETGTAVFFGGGANVAIAVEVCLENAVDASDQREAADVELAPLHEQRVVDVFLQDHGPAASAVLMYEVPDPAQLLLDLDACASVRVLSRLDDPNVLSVLVLLAAHTFTLVILLKFVEFCIALAMFDVESQRQSVKDTVLIITAVRVVVPHVEEEGLLVVQVLVEFEAVVHFLELSFAFLKLVLEIGIGH